MRRSVPGVARSAPHEAHGTTAPVDSRVERLAVALGGDIDRALLAGASATSMIASRAKELGLDDEAYALLLQRDAEEIMRLRTRLVPPETWFFRYEASYEHLRAAAKARREEGAADPMRIASLGCATGAEAFSIVAALESLGGASVVAVDRDAEALARARCGRLSGSSVRVPAPAWASAPWRLDGSEVVVRRELLESVEFVHADLFEPGLAQRLGRFHAVFCRNVAIYLEPVARCRLGALIRSLLVPGGWLYFGHAEGPAVFGIPWEERAPQAFAVHAPGAASDPATQAASIDPPCESRDRTTARRRDAKAPSASRAAPTSRRRLEPAPDPIERVRELADRGLVSEAIEAAEKAHRRGDRSADLLELLGTLSLGAGRLDDAERHLRAALYLDPERETAAIQLSLLSERRRV